MTRNLGAIFRKDISGNSKPGFILWRKREASQTKPETKPMFQISSLYPNADNTFDMITSPLDGQLQAALKTGRIHFINGIYKLNKTTNELEVDIVQFLRLLDAIQETEYTTPLYTISEGKPLKLKLTAEVMALSKITHATVWDYEKIGEDRRVEGAVVGDHQAGGGPSWLSMCFPFSNFGNGQNFGKTALEFVSMETLKRIVYSKKHVSDWAHVDWVAMESLLGICSTSTEFVLQAWVKGMAALLMPLVLDLLVEETVKSYEFNIQKLNYIKVPKGTQGITSFKATFEINSNGGQHSFKGECRHEKPILVDTLKELVEVSNDYIFWLLSNPTVRASDSTVKALCNALHINPIFFGNVGNGTPYPLGALGDDIGTNSMANAVGNLLRILTQPEFKMLMEELYIKRGAKVGELAMHKRVNKADNTEYYYVDNTYGGGLCSQLGPLMTSTMEVDGKELVFYNALGHGYSLAGKVLQASSEDKDIENAIGTGLIYIFTRIVNAC